MSADATAGHLFAGIDGFGLGLAAAGIRPAWTVELDAYCDEVLALRLPDVERMRDVREVRDPPPVRVITGGFPCQDLSNAGNGAGITGQRSGLYAELVRIVGEVEPDLVLIENVPALLHRGFELVVRDLVALGYGVEWDCLPAAAFGAPHLRDRVWIAAHRGGAPTVFGSPATLFALAPAQATELVGGDGDDDEERTAWLRWPRAGWVDGDPELVLPLQPVAPLPDVKRGRVLFPTPLAADGNRRNLVNFGRNDTLLGSCRGLWPTVGAIDATSGHTGRADTKGRHSLALSHLANNGVLEDAEDADDAVARLDAIRWPTPKASPSGPDYARAGRERSGGDDLATAVARLPTPQASDGAGGRIDRGEGPTRDSGAKRSVSLATAVDREKRIASGALNPAWVEWLMGFPLGWTDLTVADDELVVASWAAEPDGVPRVTAGTPRRRERLTALGNALVPQAPAWLIARALPLLSA